MKNWKKKLVAGFGILALAVVIGAVGMSYYFGKMVVEGLFFQNEGNDTKGNSVKQLEAWNWDLEGFEETYEGQSFTLEASDGNVIPVTYFNTDGNQDKDTVILIHGLGGDHVFSYPMAAVYLQNGWNVLTFDQRASGDSQNELVTFGYLESLDVEALVDYAREITEGKLVAVHGQSMGGATAGMYAVTDHGAEYADAVIMDSPVHSMRDMFLEVWHQMDDVDGIPDDYIIACGDLYMKLHYGFTFKDVEINDLQQYNEVKTLVIASSQDEICPPKQVETLYQNVAAADKEWLEIDCEHIKGLFDYPEAYESAVMEFLAK